MVWDVLGSVLEGAHVARVTEMIAFESATSAHLLTGGESHMFWRFQGTREYQVPETTLMNLSVTWAVTHS